MPTQRTLENRTENTPYPPRGGNFATVFPEGATITNVTVVPSKRNPGSTFGIVEVENDEKTYTVSGVFARKVSEDIAQGRRILPAKVRAKVLPPDGVKYKYKVIVPEWL